MDNKIKISISVPGKELEGKRLPIQIKSRIEFEEPSTFQQPNKLLAIPSIDCGFNNLCEILLENQVIDKYYRWIFNDGHLVILGGFQSDKISEIECLWLIYSLEEKARKKGGYVHFITGKNLWNLLSGNWRYQQPKYARSSKKDSNNVLFNGNGEIWQWLCAKNVIEKIGNYIFTSDTIPCIAELGNRSLLGVNRSMRPYYYSSIEKKWIGPRSNPRCLMLTDLKNDGVITAILDFYNAKALIVPHLHSNYIGTMNEKSNAKIVVIGTKDTSKEMKILLIEKDVMHLLPKRKVKSSYSINN